jgi:hypothetical protein
MGRLIDADKFLERVKKDREHESYLHSWTADMVLERLDNWYAPTVEAIPKDQYETRLKADMATMLEEIQLEIEELDPFGDEWSDSLDACNDIIQQKINALKAESEEA